VEPLFVLAPYDACRLSAANSARQEQYQNRDGVQVVSKQAPNHKHQIANKDQTAKQQIPNKKQIRDTH
jgi:hypothetical protein